MIESSFCQTGCVGHVAIFLHGPVDEEVQETEESFLHMIKGEATDEEMELLEEAGALADISHMPAHVKCAVLGWHTLENMLDDGTEA